MSKLLFNESENAALAHFPNMEVAPRLLRSAAHASPGSPLGRSLSLIVTVGYSPSLWAVYATYPMHSMRPLWPQRGGMTW